MTHHIYIQSYPRWLERQANARVCFGPEPVLLRTTTDLLDALNHPQAYAGREVVWAGKTGGIRFGA